MLVVRHARGGAAHRLIALATLLSGCASIPKHQYAMDELHFTGMRALEPEALEACLVTKERPELRFRLGFGAPSCGDPPFDSTPPALHLWSWPWTEWPVFDPAIFAVDEERIERWYEARGYYQARVTGTHAYANDVPVQGARCPHADGSDCKLEVFVRIDEGGPVRVQARTLVAEPALPEELRDALLSRLLLREGDRFDEALYNTDKNALQAGLSEASYALAQVDGRVIIDREARTARIEYRIDRGPACIFGHTRVQGAGGIPDALIIEAADVPRGEPFRQSIVEDAQRGVFALGVFSAVRIELEPEGRAVHLRVVVQRARVVSWEGGVGIRSGTLRRVTSDETFSVPQWDLHVLGGYENKNFLGGLRKLRIEDRPALILLDEFPSAPASGPRLGNVLSVRFDQPAFVEARTKLLANAAWDLGPDPFQGFFRHDIATKLTLERAFFSDQLIVRVAAQHDVFEVADDENAPSGVSDYRLPFLEQQVIVDIRDDPGRPRTGIYASVTVQEAFRFGSYGSWDYIRVTPDLRGYVPVFWDVVLAARFAVGMMFVREAAAELDETSAALGPQTYRLRGGGATSNRGFSAGRLGAGVEGGARRWEASLELRIPLGGELGLALFGDAGDVSRARQFRFDHWNAAAGFGVRYYSILGALRLDAGWRLPGLQVIGDASEPDFDSGVLPSAIHLTIGEAF